MSRPPRPGDEWTPPEDELLRALWPTALPVAEIAERVGRSPQACKKRAGYLHITGTRSRGPRGGTAAPPPKADKSARNRGTAWTPDEDKRLRRLLREGRTMEEVAPLLGRSEAAIDNRAKFLGLARRTLPNGERQWYDPLLVEVPARTVTQRSSSNDVWRERPPPRYGAHELIALWTAAMARVAGGAA